MISSRQKQILGQLIEKQDFFTVEQLAQKYDVSHRSIRNDILALELFLEDKKIEFTRDRKKGIKLELLKESLDQLKEFLNNGEEYLSPEIRIKAIARDLLVRAEINFEELADKFKISHKTLVSDLTELKPWFQNYKLQLTREKGNVITKGREQNKRKAYLHLIKEEATGERILDYILNEKSNVGNVLQWEDWFQPKEINYLSDVVLQLEESLSIGFTDDGYVALILHMYLSTERLKKQHFVSMEDQLFSDLTSTKEFEVVKSIVKRTIEPYFQIELPYAEIAYITQHVLTAQRNYVKDKDDEECLQFATEIVIEVEKSLSRPLAMSKQIIKNLAMHLKPAIYRYKCDKQIFNPLFKELKKEFGDMMDEIHRITNIVLSPKGIRFNEHEASYIAMHIGAGLRNFAPSTTPKRVVIACSSGLGTANILKRKLLDMYPKINIVKQCSYKDLKDLTYETADIVISTIDIYCYLQIPWIKVSPIVSNEDELKIIDVLGMPHMKDEKEYELINSVNEVIKIFERHGNISNRVELSKDLIHYFKGTTKIEKKKTTSLGISEILPLDSILLQKEIPQNINHMIKIGMVPLQKRGLAGVEYEERLAKMISDPNNHFLITDGVIFPHAGSQWGVWGTGISLVTFRNPVKFDQLAKPIWLMITLVAEDNEKHVDALALIIDALNDDIFMDKLKKSHSNVEVYNWLQQREGSLYEKDSCCLY